MRTWTSTLNVCVKCLYEKIIDLISNIEVLFLSFHHSLLLSVQLVVCWRMLYRCPLLANYPLCNKVFSWNTELFGKKNKCLTICISIHSVRSDPYETDNVVNPSSFISKVSLSFPDKSILQVYSWCIWMSGV